MLLKKEITPPHSLQSGYILMVLLVIMTLGAATWFSSGTQNLGKALRDAHTQAKLKEMEIIKQKLLTYASLTPEIMQTESSSSPPPAYTYKNVPGPGYLPCWDNNGDGEMNCAFNDYTPNYLPRQISTRNLYFSAQPKDYYYVLDHRFAIQNAAYNNGSTSRYAPLNPSVTPALELNNNGKKYVALIIYAPKGLNAANQDGDKEFVSRGLLNPGVEDLIVGITQDEWEEVVLRRVCNLRTLLNTSSANNFWYRNYDSVNNPAGNSWENYFTSGGTCP